MDQSRAGQSRHNKIRGLKDMRATRRVRGVSLTEVAIGLFILALTTAGTVPFALQLSRNAIDERVAGQVQQISKAAEAYVAANFAAVETAAVGAAAPVEITLATLTGANILPSGFVDGDPNGATHRVIVRRPAAGVLEITTFTQGGVLLDDARGMGIAARIPGGGFVKAGLPTQISGAGTSLAIANFAGAPAAPAAGALAATTYSSAATTLTDFVYRSPVTGNAAAQTLAPGSTFDANGQPLVGLNGLTPLTGSPVTVIGDLAVTGNSTATGTITASYLRASTVVTAGAACASGQGSIAQDASGNPLVCVGGLWTAIAGSGGGAISAVSGVAGEFTGTKLAMVKSIMATPVGPHYSVTFTCGGVVNPPAMQLVNSAGGSMGIGNGNGVVPRGGLTNMPFYTPDPGFFPVTTAPNSAGSVLVPDPDPAGIYVYGLDEVSNRSGMSVGLNIMASGLGGLFCLNGCYDAYRPASALYKDRTSNNLWFWSPQYSWPNGGPTAGASRPCTTWSVIGIAN
jgi:hypothetical protein